MSDWQVGDLALCVKKFGNKGACLAHPHVTPGRIFEVEAIMLWKSRIFLVLKGYHSGHSTLSHGASCFRKITPPSADEFDRETIALMNRAPIKEPVQ